ncbi:MAG: ATP-dependent DNA helicase RecG [Candidatus Omnitrophica bacterium]|nr:ATP-dependent DNA helicase RecG [Candidatus Omnitrophota bacterium]
MTVSQAPPSPEALRYVKGVGPSRMQQLAQLGIATIEDVYLAAPRRYEDRTRFAAIGEAQPGETTTVKGQVLSKTLRRIRGGRTIVEIAVGDDTGVLYGTWFNQPYLAGQVRVGDELLLYGQLEPRTRRQMIHPEIERIEGGEDASLHLGRIVPVYPLTAGLTQRWFRRMVATVLATHSGAIEETLPPALPQQRGWPSRRQAIHELHFPASWDALNAARERLAFEELLVFQAAIAQRRSRNAAVVKPQRYALDGPVSRSVQQQLPFQLTASQQAVLRELLEDLQRRSPMRRLLQGDVGCGKTIVMALVTAAAAQSGYQVALMAPTELLAEQHARTMRDLLEPCGVAVGLLSQGLTPSERTQRLADIASGRLQVIIGTHALIQRPVQFHRLALVIIDEQHKFGVAQRAQLAGKGQQPDVLIVTATPIPRTLAMTLYGDLDISTITELPAGRQPITTRWLRESQRAEAYAMLRRELTRGRQAYVVYPLVEESSSTELRAATRMAKHLQAEVFPEVRVGLLHGQMKPAQKEQAMLAFSRGQLQVLVSTVIVEVGLDVPRATFMLIEHPERFGLAQLHQLRGRIGRGREAATCVAISDTDDEAASARLRAFVETTDGFQLAETDLQLRGPGELLGRQQHGLVRFRVANLARDQHLLALAREEAYRRC